MALAISAPLQTQLQIETYPADARFTGARPAALVLPGGGFREHPRHEGEGYARWLSGIGVHAFVLNYRLEPFPAPLADARAGLEHARHGDHGLAVDPARVGVVASSAGGLLAGLLMTGGILSLESPERPPPRPDFAVLAYALADLDLLPEAAVEAFLGDQVSLRDELSPVRHLRGPVCPTFVWTTAEDAPGFTNAVAWANGLVETGTPVELHVYPRGRHGLGLADGVPYGGHGRHHVPHTARWAAACEAWLGEEGIL